MSEEIKDAGVVVPRAMVWSYVINGGLGFIFLVTYLFMITDVEAALEDWYPHIWVSHLNFLFFKLMPNFRTRSSARPSMMPASWV